MFEIEVDRSQSFVAMRLRGLWDSQTLARFKTELTLALGGLGRRQSGYVCLCDLTDFPVQTGKVVDAFSAFLQTPGVGARKTAFLANGALLKMQTKRISVLDEADDRFFADRAAALEWLGISDS